jgi:hypothetical protein
VPVKYRAPLSEPSTAGPIYVSNAGQLGDVGETVVCAGAACHGYLSFCDRDPEAAYFIWHLFGMPLHLRLKTREHYRTLLDAHLLREVRRWFTLGQRISRDVRPVRAAGAAGSPRRGAIVLRPYSSRRGGAAVVRRLYVD